MRIAVLGANGQVGSEVCLLLNRAPGIEVVPICRNRSGSAFLRSRGIACRHGLAADPVQARALLGDCDLVANFSLAVGRPREAREANRRLIDAAAEASLPGARVIYFSTLAVNASFVPSGTPAFMTAYGKEKLRGERDALRAGRRTGKLTWVLRLGHVYGELQGIRAEMRRLVNQGAIALPQRGELGSNVTHTVTIVDAILKIGAGLESPGTYDLLSFPVWSWRKVLEREARDAGVALELDRADAPASESPGGTLSGFMGLARLGVSSGLASPRIRELGLAWISHLPESINLRLQSAHFRRRARAEIALLNQSRATNPALLIPPVRPVVLTSLAYTETLLDGGAGRIGDALAAAFPPDLPAATGV